jgi:hypothetical protein
VIASFYDEVLREILAALGGAMFVSRVLVLVRRGRHERLVDVPAGPSPLGGSAADDGEDTALDGAALDDPAFDDAAVDDPAFDDEARTLVFLVLGFVVMVAGLASLAA